MRGVLEIFFEWRMDMDCKKVSWIKKKRWIFLGVVMAFVMAVLPINDIQVRAEGKIIRVGYDTNSNFIRNDGHEYYGY